MMLNTCAGRDAAVIRRRAHHRTQAWTSGSWVHSQRPSARPQPARRRVGPRGFDSRTSSSWIHGACSVLCTARHTSPLRQQRPLCATCSGGTTHVETAARVALTVGCGAAGAAAFKAAGAPLAFMLGSLFGSSAAALAGAPVLLPPPVRLTWQTIIGVALGANFTVELFTRAGQLSQSLAGLLVATSAATAGAALILRKLARYELPTSFFAAVPGGLNDMTLVGGELGGDERIIALSHTVRLVAVVSLLPFFMRRTLMPAMAPVEATAAHAATAAVMTVTDVALLGACAALGPAIGRRLRLPARYLVGPLLLSGVAHVAGLTHAAPPKGLLALAQIVVGSAVGCRFAGVRVGAMRGVVAWALCTTSVQMVVSAACAAAMSGWSGTPFPVLLLAYSPGGITEMTLTSAALGLDAACVATHHIVRIMAITLGMPLAFAVVGHVRERMKFKRT